MNGKNEEGFTPIHYASYRGNIKIIIELENRGANLNETNNQGTIFSIKTPFLITYINIYRIKCDAYGLTRGSTN